MQAVAQSPGHLPAMASAVLNSTSPSSSHAGYVVKALLVLLEIEFKYFGVAVVFVLEMKSFALCLFHSDFPS